jgi:cytochrome c oxidase assembly protein subunit 11
MFCAATGFAGTPKVGTGRFEPSRLVPVPDDSTHQRIRVHFNGSRSDLLPWTFVPQQKFVDVLPGETSLAFYRAKNEGDRDVIGIATYNVTPDRVGCFLLLLLLFPLLILRLWVVFNSDLIFWLADCTIFFKGGVFLL